MPDIPVTPNTTAATGQDLPTVDPRVEPSAASSNPPSAEPTAVAPAPDDAATAGETAAVGAAAPQPGLVKPERRPKDMSPAACADLLKQHFPALFGGQPKPLKLRIQADIAQRAPGVFGKPALSAFFRRHTGSTAYLIALGKSTERFDLDGQPAGELSEEHRQLAREELARRRQITRDREQQARAQAHAQARGPQQAPAQDSETDQVQRAELRAAQAELRAQQAELRAQQAELRVQQAALQAQQAGHQQERQARLALLRDFDRTTLTMANFCALKGMKPETLAPLLAQARLEAAEAPPRPVDDRPRPGPWRDGPQGGQRDERRDFQRDGRRDGQRDGRPEGGGPRGPDSRREQGPGPGPGPGRDPAPGQAQRPRPDQRMRQDARPGPRPAQGPGRGPADRQDNRPDHRPGHPAANRPHHQRDDRSGRPDLGRRTSPAGVATAEPIGSQSSAPSIATSIATSIAPSIATSGSQLGHQPSIQAGDHVDKG